jgi:aspartate 1-decarboxylase
MKKEVLRGKIHRATVTEARPEYEGSIGIDAALLRASEIEEYDRVEVYDVTNGSRFATYAIEAPEFSGTISVNGAAARLASPGDLVIAAWHRRGRRAEKAPKLSRGRGQPRLKLKERAAGSLRVASAEAAVEASAAGDRCARRKSFGPGSSSGRGNTRRFR